MRIPCPNRLNSPLGGGFKELRTEADQARRWRDCTGSSHHYSGDVSLLLGKKEPQGPLNKHAGRTAAVQVVTAAEQPDLQCRLPIIVRNLSTQVIYVPTYLGSLLAYMESVEESTQSAVVDGEKSSMSSSRSSSLLKSIDAHRWCLLCVSKWESKRHPSDLSDSRRSKLYFSRHFIVGMYSAVH